MEETALTKDMIEHLVNTFDIDCGRVVQAQKDKYSASREMYNDFIQSFSKIKIKQHKLIRKD